MGGTKGEREGQPCEGGELHGCPHAFAFAPPSQLLPQEKF